MLLPYCTCVDSYKKLKKNTHKTLRPTKTCEDDICTYCGYYVVWLTEEAYESKCKRVNKKSSTKDLMKRAQLKQRRLENDYITYKVSCKTDFM